MNVCHCGCRLLVMTDNRRAPFCPHCDRCRCPRCDRPVVNALARECKHCGCDVRLSQVMRGQT